MILKYSHLLVCKWPDSRWEGQTVPIKDSFGQEDSSRTATSRTNRRPIATYVPVCARVDVSQTYSMSVRVGPELTVAQPDKHLTKIAKIIGTHTHTHTLIVLGHDLYQGVFWVHVMMEVWNHLVHQWDSVV